MGSRTDRQGDGPDLAGLEPGLARFEHAMDTELPSPVAAPGSDVSGSEVRYREVFERTEKGIAIYRVEGDGERIVFVDLNPAGCRMTRVRREEVVGRDVVEIFPGVKAMGLHEVFLDVWRTGRARRHPVARYRDERLQSWFDNEVFRLSSGEIVAVFEDATAQHRFEEAQERSRQRLLDAQRLGRVGFLDWDLVTGEVVWSDEFCRQVGVPLSKRVQTVETTLALVHPDDRTRVEAAPRAAVMGEAVYEAHHRVLRPDGRVAWVQAQARLERDEAGRPIRLLGTVVDVTELQHTNERLRRLNEELEHRVAERTARLEAANRELENFANSVSHDLQTPLRAIQGFADILARQYRDQLPEEAVAYFDHIAAASRTMACLIQDLHAYAKLGRQPVRIRPVELGRAVDQAWTLLSARVEEERAEIRVHGELPRVKADPLLLERMLANLMENAITYHGRGVRPRVEVRGWQEGDRVTLEIRDNGIGIPRRFHRKIFDIFQRLHPQESYQGTGVGLAVVQKCASLQEGTVSVESEPGEGSAFRVTFRGAGA